MSDEVAHPGSRPSEFDFPFAQARRLIGAIDALVSELSTAIQRREQLVGAVLPTWRGSSRERFEAEVGAELDQLRQVRSQLESQLGELEDAVATATIRREASLEAMATWESRMADYLHAQRAN